MRKKAPASDVIETTRYPARCPACGRDDRLMRAVAVGAVRICCGECQWQAKYRLREEPA